MASEPAPPRLKNFLTQARLAMALPPERPRLLFDLHDHRLNFTFRGYPLGLLVDCAMHADDELELKLSGVTP